MLKLSLMVNVVSRFFISYIAKIDVFAHKKEEEKILF